MEISVVKIFSKIQGNYPDMADYQNTEFWLAHSSDSNSTAFNCFVG